MRIFVLIIPQVIRISCFKFSEVGSSSTSTGSMSPQERSEYTTNSPSKTCEKYRECNRFEQNTSRTRKMKKIREYNAKHDRHNHWHFWKLYTYLVLRLLPTIYRRTHTSSTYRAPSFLSLSLISSKITRLSNSLLSSCLTFCLIVNPIRIFF